MKKKQVLLPNNETYHYVEAGNGEKTLLFVHGNMASGLHYIPFIENMKNEYRILSPDLRGFGDSSYNTAIDSLEDLSDDLAMFLNALNVKNVHVFGWSAGGPVVLKLAAKYTNLVDKIILIESGSYRGYPIYQKDEVGQVRFGVNYESKEDLAKDAVNVVPILMAQQSGNRDFMAMIFKAALYNVGTPCDAFDTFIDEALKQRNLVDFDWALCNFNMSNFTNGMTVGDGSIANVANQVLSFWGDQDIVVLEYMVDETVEALQNATKITIKDAGHSPVDTHTEIMLKEIKDFL